MTRHEPGSPECRELFARLSEYLDLELDPERCRSIDGHLEDCPPCRVFLESLQRTVDLIRDARPARLPDRLREELLEAYRKLPGDAPS